MRKINQAGLDLIKGFEGLRLDAYQDSVGVWTIGYGSTAGVHKGQHVTADQAEDLLRNDLGTAERGVEAALGDIGNGNQFSACVSLAFNVGVHAFAGSSIVKLMKAGDMFGAADRFMQWNKAGGQIVKGLTRRREAERKLFLTPDDGDDQHADTQPLAVDPPAEPDCPVEPSTQTVEGGGSGTQVVVGTANATDTAQIAAIQAVEARAGEEPIQATTAGPKSFWTTLTGGIAALPAAVWGILQGNAEAIKWALLVAGAIVIVYLIRMLILDVMRNYAAMRPDRHNVK